jgi:uncharacterized protein (DUF1800 family)
MVVTWNEENAAHLLRRAGFGPRPPEVASAVKKGMAKTIAGLFKPWKKSDKLPKKPKTDSLEDLQAWWLRRMLATKSPLIEKMALFWHNHFATALSKVERLPLMHQQNRTLRKLAVGKFSTLCLALARDPAMVIWLDNISNIASDPNENFARELMELFTTGVLDAAGQPNYTETDVQESARAFTGWTLDDKFKFVFDPANHDFGTKTFRGQTANFDGTDIVAMLVVDPATARPARVEVVVVLRVRNDARRSGARSVGGRVSRERHFDHCAVEGRSSRRTSSIRPPRSARV